jgi:hypothetical protein
VSTLTLAIKLPAVKWAYDTVTNDFGPFTHLLTDTIAQMCSHVRAIRINRFGFARLGSENHEIFVKVKYGLGLTRTDFICVRDVEPPIRHG